MKRTTTFKDNVLPLLAVVVLGVLGIDTFYRVFVVRPAAGAAEATVSLALDKARPWSATEQQVLARLLPPCRQPAQDGKLKEMVECWHHEAQQAPAPNDKAGQSDEAILTSLLDRAGYKR